MFIDIYVKSLIYVSVEAHDACPILNLSFHIDRFCNFCESFCSMPKLILSCPFAVYLHVVYLNHCCEFNAEQTLIFFTTSLMNLPHYSMIVL